jgi:hypothetical protein
MSQDDLQPLEIPAGLGGLNRMKNLAQVPRTDLTMVEALTFENNTWQKEGGASKYNSAPLGGSVLALRDFFDDNFTQYLMAYLDTGSWVTAEAAGAGVSIGSMTAQAPGWFVEAWVNQQNKALFLFTGEDKPKYSTGGVALDIELASADWSAGNYPAFGFLHKARLIAPLKHRAYCSSPQSHDRFGQQAEDATQLNIYPGEGQKITAGISFREKAYLWKYPKGIYLIDDTDTNISNWQTPKLTDAVGVAGPGCVVATEDDVIFLDSDGYFHQLSAVRTFGQESVPAMFPTELSDWFRSQINLNRLDLVRSVYYSRNRQLVFALPGTGSSVNNRLLTLDFNIGDKTRIGWSTRDVCPSLALRQNVASQQLVAGDASGFVWTMDEETRSKDGAGYVGQYETPTFDVMDKGIRLANLHELQVVFNPVGDWDLTMEVHRDGTLGQTLLFSMQSTGGAVGSFSLDSDVLGGTTIQNAIQRLEGDCKYLKLLGRNNGAGQNFSVMNHLIRYKPGRHAWF